MAAEIGKNVSLHSVWLYGSIVLDDFQPGWSDIDLIALATDPITPEQADRLVTLRQALTEEEPSNRYYRWMEGIIVPVSEYQNQAFTRLVYWGTSGQRITDKYRSDPFARFELAKYGRLVFGSADKALFPLPDQAELTAAIQRHYETIRTFAVQTDESLYSCGWLLDIARCIYTLRHHDVIGKTQAGKWALSQHLFPDEAPLKTALLIRQSPLVYKDRPEIRQWLGGLGSVVQRYADVLEKELAERS
ncbi:MAG: DUF4111 domain-containing protein [Clostridia bacterium]|nr:DUF4111 domain-containing protein [Clostridia bacterium]